MCIRDREYDALGVVVPAHVTGAVSGADLVSPVGCTVTDAPFGADSAGPDQVIPLHGLRGGVAYVVRLVAGDDLQFYVTTGCNTPQGPGGDQCLLFEDASLDTTEVGRFVATGTTAYVVVDYYASHAPVSTAFALDVYEEQCSSEAQCGGETPACSDGPVSYTH